MLSTLPSKLSHVQNSIVKRYLGGKRMLWSFPHSWRHLAPVPSTQPIKNMAHERTLQKQELHGSHSQLQKRPTNSPFHAQNAVECDRVVKHRQHVNLIYNHMEIVPAGWAKEGEHYLGSLPSPVPFFHGLLWRQFTCCSHSASNPSKGHSNI